MGNSDSFDTGTGELAPRTGEFLAGVLALSRISRVTVALESGHRAGPALQEAAKLTAHAETSVLFDRWRGDPLADLAAALFSAHPDVAPAPGESLAQGLRRLQSRERRSLLVIFDRFDDYLAQPADDPRNAAFDQAFVQMANDDELDVHFLLVQDEAAESLLGRFQDGIPGIGDGCLRMPAGGIGDSRDETPTAAPDAGRASRRDRSFGMLLERLTAIAPGDEAAPGQPREAIPPAPPRPAESGQPPADVEPVQRVQPAGNDTIVNDTLADRAIQDQPASEPEPEPEPQSQWQSQSQSQTSPAPKPEPVITRREPSFSAYREADLAPPAAPEPSAVLPTPADPPARTPEPAAAAPRSKAPMALLAVVLAAAAGFYAYRHQAPAKPEATAAASIASPGKDAAAAREAETAAPQPKPANPAPPLMAAPSMAATAPAPAPASEAPAAAPAAPTASAAPTAPTAPAASGPIAARGTPTVYIHVRSQRERDRLQAMARKLAGQGIKVVDVKVMNKGPSVADVRYFRDEDREAALTVQKALSAAGVPVPRLSRMNGFENSTRPGHFEAWLGSDYTPDPVRRR
ncbi:SPOR domain-containing protein [Noviherbaspirillum suwonense]|uniref:Sporulation related domain-containing protein n=1 Tax=Noviherbaspirillum suwonense TaxID=1224511 RepID=A0ABY1QM40_9BURK|nr:SPOR domain-containing protein [Noviherbaspirillum suwonense]SMP74672.1 Sporulation related domain-containing protein [Noviherbaspirillum suwonense]